MPRYFFHVHNGRILPDNVGVELFSDDDAKAQAAILSGELLSDLGSEFWKGEGWSLQVIKDDGTAICELEISARVCHQAGPRRPFLLS